MRSSISKVRSGPEPLPCTPGGMSCPPGADEGVGGPTPLPAPVGVIAPDRLALKPPPGLGVAGEGRGLSCRPDRRRDSPPLGRGTGTAADERDTCLDDEGGAEDAAVGAPCDEEWCRPWWWPGPLRPAEAGGAGAGALPKGGDVAVAAASASASSASSARERGAEKSSGFEVRCLREDAPMRLLSDLNML